MLSNFDPATRTMVLATDGSLEDRSTIKPDRNNFGPRLGFAYTLTPTTVVRGGYGISYVHFHRAGGANVLPINGPQVINAVVVQTDRARSELPAAPAGLSGGPDRSVAVQSARAPTSPTCRATTTRAACRAGSRRCSASCGRNTMLDVAYVGNRADGMLLFANFNQARAEQRRGHDCRCRRAGRSRSSRDITYSFNGGKSRYHALPGASSTGACARGLSLLNSLTLSQTKDNGAGSLENPNGNFPAPQDFYNLDADYGLSAYHQPYNSTTSFVSDLPFGRGRTLPDRRHRRWSTRCSAAGRSPASTRIDAGETVTLTYTPARSVPGVGHSAGLPRRQQLPAERRSATRCVPDGERTINNWFNRDDGRRCRPIRASRSATRRATACAARCSGRSTWSLSKRFRLPWQQRRRSSSASRRSTC